MLVIRNARPVTNASDNEDRSNCPPPDSPEMERMEVLVLLIAKEKGFRWAQDMSAGLASIEERRAADRQRVAEYLESQRPFTDEEWAAQLRLFEAAGRERSDD